MQVSFTTGCLTSIKGLNHQYHNSNELNDVLQNQIPPTWPLTLLSLPPIFYPPSTDSYVKSSVTILKHQPTSGRAIFWGYQYFLKRKDKEQIKDLKCMLGKIYGTPLLV
jgi:hypothetical protein